MQLLNRFRIAVVAVGFLVLPLAVQSGVVRHWLVLGPFPYQQGVPEPLNASGVQSESGLRPGCYQELQGRFWLPVQTDADGKIDFLRLGFEQVDYVNTYLHTYVYSPRKQEVEFLAGVNDGAIVWLNGHRVFTLPTGHGRAWKRASRSFAVTLEPGWNSLLCKVANLAKNYAFSLETPVPDLVFSTEGPGVRSEQLGWLVTWLGFDESAHLRENGDLVGQLALGLTTVPGSQPAAVTVAVTRVTRGTRRTLGKVRVAPGEEQVEQEQHFEVPLRDLFGTAAREEELAVELRGKGRSGTVRRPLRFPAGLLLRMLFAKPLAVDRWTVHEANLTGAVSRAAFAFVRERSAGTGKKYRVYAVPLRVPAFLADFPLGISLVRPDCEARAFWSGQPMAGWDRDGNDVVAWKATLGSAGSRRGALELALVGGNLDRERLGWPELTLLSPELSEMWNNAELAAQVLQKRLVPDDAVYRQWAGALLAGGRKALSSLATAYTAQIAAEARPLRSDTINFIGNSHIDLQWTWRWHETVNVCKATFGQALRFMEEYPDFMYAQSQAQAYAWMEEFAPDVFEGIKQAVKRGQWVVVGDSWCEPDANVPSGESHVRQILYGKRYFRKKLGAESRIVWLPDTFGFPATLPKIFKHCQMDYFATQKLRYRFDVPFPYDVFWWQAKDGSRLLSFMTYGYDTRLHEVPSFYLRFKERTGLDNVLFLYGVGDHGGGPSREMIRTIHKMARAEAFPVVRHLRPDVALARMPQPGVSIPTWQDELYLQYHRGTYTSQSEVKKTNRRLEVLLGEAEKFNALLPKPRPPWEIEKAWRKVLLEQFHDVLAGSSIHGVYEDVFAEYDIAERWAREVRDAALDSLEAKIDTRGKGVPVVVWNSLPWERTDVARVQLPPGFTAAKVSVVDERGRAVPSQVSEGDVVWLAQNVPSLGYRVFWLRPRKGKKHERVQAANYTARNELLRLELDPQTGRIRNLSLRSGGRLVPVLADQEGGNALVFLGDRGNAWNLEYTGKVETAEPVSVKLAETGPVFARFRVERRYGESRFVQDIFVYRNLDRIDVRTTADWHAKHVTAKAAFPLAFRVGTAVFDQPYGVVERPTVPRTAIDSTKFEVSGQQWVDMSAPDGRVGLAL
ncbi:MAG: alpha-mannosidase, partial [Calditrichaeota bacterium]|nr:alpha-mannosidase [Calditrichota bacterium]